MQSSNAKYLGVIIDGRMYGEEQLETVKRKIRKVLEAISKLRNILSHKQLATVYGALIETNLRYCGVIWGRQSN